MGFCKTQTSWADETLIFGRFPCKTWSYECGLSDHPLFQAVKHSSKFLPPLPISDSTLVIILFQAVKHSSEFLPPLPISDSKSQQHSPFLIQNHNTLLNFSLALPISDSNSQHSSEFLPRTPHFCLPVDRLLRAVDRQSPVFPVKSNMEQVKWSSIRTATKELLFYENHLNHLRSVAHVEESRLQGQQEEKKTIKKQLKKYRKKRERTENLEKREKYNDDVNELEKSYTAIRVEVETAKHVAEAKEAHLANILEKRDSMKLEIEQMLRNFETGKWVKLMDVADLVAIRMMRYLPGKKKVLRFTVGRSVKEAMLDSMHNAAHEMEIEGLRSRWLFELDEGIFRTLSAEESRKLGYGRGL
ncbi:hypothetical protein Pfo_012376 [Paulownia fortunei]|nr:hypothetical protein Pfo_012376 [Paulownia fortunei]